MASNSIPSEIVGLSDVKRRLLAQRLKGSAALSSELDSIEPRPAGSRTPISVDQYRIWLHASMQPELPIYNEPVVLRYQGNLDLALLETSFNRFLQRHEAWRTSFKVDHDEVLQVIHPELGAKLDFVDLVDLPDEERDAEAMRLTTQQASSPIDLKTAPLFRTLVLRIAPEKYEFHLVLHHVIFDGLSLNRTFLPELAAIYNALAAGTETLLPKRKLQYSDYAAWRQKQVESPAMDLHVGYWRKQLAGELPVLRLPADRSRPAVISQRGSVERFVISRELTESLRELGHAHGATLYMTMLAVFKVLLFRYTGQEDVIVGGAGDARRRPELQGMMGYILDTFAVRSYPTAELPFSSFLSSVRKKVIEALDAADVPFDRVVRSVGTKRDPSHHPLFQSFFVFQPDAASPPKSWEMAVADVTVGAAKFDIYLEVDERPTHTAARIMYSTDLFDADRIRRMAGHWMTLLEAACKNPHGTIGSLPILTQEEQELMLVRWNDTAREIPATTMHGLVEAQVKLTPDAIAVVYEKTSWTYLELDRRAEMLAAHIQAAGAGPGRLVAMCIDRSENLLASLLAILKTGAAYLPLDPGVPRARILLCLEDAAPAVLLTQRSIAQDLSHGEAAVLLIEDLLDAGPLSSSTDSSVARNIAAVHEDVAYVIHTSGSTGRPKAVELRHSSVVNLLLSMQREPGFAATDTLLAVTTISFDIAVLELFLPLISGGRVVIANRAAALDPTLLAALIKTHSCTVMQATPATWRALLANDWPGQTGLKILCGGERLPRDVADRLLELNMELWNVYGPTETTIWSTVQHVSAGTGTISIGGPISNTTTYILDSNQQPVPVGIPGELYLGGLGLANGYRGQPELTAQKFLTPAIAKGERLYRTGDYALYHADGTIECRGRADNQVKVRGFRIELEDVETTLCKNPGVAAAAAKVWPDPVGGNRLVAYVVCKGGVVLSSSDVRDFLKSRVPEYMIPSDIVTLEKMPLTPNGKMDRNALAEPGQGSSRAIKMIPSTEEEIKLAKIWAEVLGLEAVGADDNFFDLGGHSLILVRLFSRINKEFHTSLPITTIFETGTLSELARALKEKASMSSLVPVQPNGNRPPLFMAHSYLLYRGLSNALGPNQPFYGLRELPEDGDLSIKERALQYIEDMRRVQPAGPYRVAGWCAAGPLAVEIATQLSAQGEKVSALLLFDSWLPGYPEQIKAQLGKNHWFPPLEILRGKLQLYKTRMNGLGMEARLRYLLGLLIRIFKNSRDLFYVRHWVRVERLSKALGFPLPQFMHNTTMQTYAALYEFRAKLIPVEITLFRARQSGHISGATDSCGWEQVAQAGVNVLWAPGDHETMFLGKNLQNTAELVGLSLGDTPPTHWPGQRQQVRSGASAARW